MSHFYKNEYGNTVPSVTTILKLLHKDGIAEWANSLGFMRKSYKETLFEYANIGTLMHEAIECELLGKKRIPYINNIIEKKIEKRIDNFNIWRTKNNLVFDDIRTEVTYTSYTYAGTCDCIASINGKYTLIDFKSSKKIYPSQFIQAAAYLGLIFINDPKLFDKIEDIMIISITDKDCSSKSMSKLKANKYMEIFKLLVLLYYQYNEVLKTDWDSSLGEDNNDK